MRAYELVTLTYFAYVVVLAWLRPRVDTRLTLTGAALVVVAVLVGSRGIPLARDWVPNVFVLVGYWASGLLFVAPMTGLEARLAAADRRLFAAMALPTRLARSPRLLLEFLELLYFVTPAMLPAGLAIVLAAGRPDLVDRYWTTVLTAEFGAFAALPWLQTRPPRDVEPESVAVGALACRRLTERLISPLTIGVNTLPSGHASGSLAVALAAGVAAPFAGLALLGMALGISVASVVGRYHYAVDVAAGLVLGLAAFAAGMLIA